MRLRQVLVDHEIPQSLIASTLGVAASTVSQKMSGSRRWTLEEADRLMTWLRDDYAIDLTLRDLIEKRP